MTCTCKISHAAKIFCTYKMSHTSKMCHTVKLFHEGIQANFFVHIRFLIYMICFM